MISPCPNALDLIQWSVRSFTPLPPKTGRRKRFSALTPDLLAPERFLLPALRLTTARLPLYEGFNNKHQHTCLPRLCRGQTTHKTNTHGDAPTNASTVVGGANWSFALQDTRVSWASPLFLLRMHLTGVNACKKGRVF